jgi:asparaginyl-tRNA synthetase
MGISLKFGVDTIGTDSLSARNNSQTFSLKASDVRIDEFSPFTVCCRSLQRLTYTDAIELLKQAVADGVTFEEKVEWGMDLPSEMERYLAETVYKMPVVLTDYPKGIKAFYMKLNDDGKTVAAADILVPKIGEIIGGSQREHRKDVLVQRCIESGIDPKMVWWYLDLRKYGTVPHAGFGLGFERLILFITGLQNIRDVIPFPRWAGNAEF